MATTRLQTKYFYKSNLYTFNKATFAKLRHRAVGVVSLVRKRCTDLPAPPLPQHAQLYQLTDYGWFQVDKDSTWHVFASTSLAKEGVEGIVSATDSLVRRHLTIRLDAVLKTVELPAGISDLDAGLSSMDRDTLTLFKLNKRK